MACETNHFVLLFIDISMSSFISWLMKRHFGAIIYKYSSAFTAISASAAFLATRRWNNRCYRWKGEAPLSEQRLFIFKPLCRQMSVGVDCTRLILLRGNQLMKIISATSASSSFYSLWWTFLLENKMPRKLTYFNVTDDIRWLEPGDTGYIAWNGRSRCSRQLINADILAAVDDG